MKNFVLALLAIINLSAVASNLNAQNLADKIAELEKGTARLTAIESRLDRIESKLDALTQTAASAPAQVKADPCTTCKARVCNSEVCARSGCELGDCVVNRQKTVVIRGDEAVVMGTKSKRTDGIGYCSDACTCGCNLGLGCTCASRTYTDQPTYILRPGVYYTDPAARQTFQRFNGGSASGGCAGGSCR